MEAAAVATDAGQRLMRIWAAAALLLALAACAKPLNAQQIESKWRLCERAQAPQMRVDACTKVVESSADATRRAAALVDRGAARAQLGQQTRAVADFGRALRIDAHNAQALLQRGIVHEERGAFGSAVADFDAALLIDPTLREAAEHRYSALDGRVNALSEALERLDEVIARDPRNAGNYNERCWLRAINNDELDKALVDCNESLRLRPNDANVLDSRGLVHFRRGEYQAAVDDYNAAVSLDARNGHYLYGRGISRIKLGLTAEGQADLAHAAELDPSVAGEYRSYGVGL